MVRVENCKDPHFTPKTDFSKLLLYIHTQLIPQTLCLRVEPKISLGQQKLFCESILHYFQSRISFRGKKNLFPSTTPFFSIPKVISYAHPYSSQVDYFWGSSKAAILEGEGENSGMGFRISSILFSSTSKAAPDLPAPP